MPQGSTAAFAEVIGAGPVVPPNTKRSTPPTVAAMLTLSAPERYLLVAGAIFMVILGFLGTYLVMRGHGSSFQSPLESHLQSRVR